MRARLIDPMGPWWARAAIPALGASSMLASIFTSAGALFFAGCSVLFLGGLLRARFAPRDVTLEIGAGHVDVRDAGLLRQRIRARNVTGASTARLDRGVGLALQRRRFDRRPTLIEVESSDDAKKLRDALGIGHFGFGTLEWPRPRGAAGALATAMRAVCGAMTAFFAVRLALVGEFHSDAASFAMASFFVSVFVLAIATLVRMGEAAPAIRMNAAGVGAQTAKGTREGPYSAIENASAEPRALRLTLEQGEHVVVPTGGFPGQASTLFDEERAHIAAQIRSAARRARGEGEPARELPSRVADLAKRGEPARAWLARVDAVARAFARDAGYRGVGFDEADLWATVADHDAPADVRAAAARVLVRVAREGDGTVERVESLLEAVRDDTSRKKIRVALDDDLERASEELDDPPPRATRRAS